KTPLLTTSNEMTNPAASITATQRPAPPTRRDRAGTPAIATTAGARRNIAKALNPPNAASTPRPRLKATSSGRLTVSGDELDEDDEPPSSLSSFAVSPVSAFGGVTTSVPARVAEACSLMAAKLSSYFPGVAAQSAFTT